MTDLRGHNATERDRNMPNREPSTPQRFEKLGLNLLDEFIDGLAEAHRQVNKHRTIGTS